MHAMPGGIHEGDVVAVDAEDQLRQVVAADRDAVDEPCELVGARYPAAPLGLITLAAMLLLLEKMLRLFDFVIGAGGPISIVWRMLANLIPEYAGLAIPLRFGRP